jgi:hypothetical protein
MRNVIGILFAAGSIAVFGNWLPLGNADPLPEKKIVDVREMSVKEKTDLGEKLIFGAVGASQTQGAIGKAQCPLCHGFNKGSLSERAPNLLAITTRAGERLNDPRYHLGKPNERDTVQKEAFPGSGTATNALEYLAESDACPSCYVVAGFGVRETHDRESPAVTSFKPPISLSIDELIAITTWLYVHDGKEPPSPQEIENAYRKFIPAIEWPMPSRDPEIYPARYAPVPPPPPLHLSGQEPINKLFIKALCFACHIIPGIPNASGVVGPKLVMKTVAPKRLKDQKYKGKATNVREYIIESILNPSVYVVEGYPDNIMPKDYRAKLTDAAVEKMAEYLEQVADGERPPMIMK